MSGCLLLWSYSRSRRLPHGKSPLRLLPFISLSLTRFSPHGRPILQSSVFRPLMLFGRQWRAFHTDKRTLVCFGDSGSYVASSQLASKSFRLHSECTAGWWLVHCLLTLCHLLSGSHPSYLPPLSVFFSHLLHHLFFSPFLLNLGAHFYMSSPPPSH